MKGKDGNLINYSELSETSSQSNLDEGNEKENNGEGNEKKNSGNAVKKVKKLVKKDSTDKIQGEQTLEMLKKVLNKAGCNSKIIKEGKSISEKEETKTKAKKGKKVVKKPVDTMTKFFNEYYESPHLQSIEDSYLKYLEA